MPETDQGRSRGPLSAAPGRRFWADLAFAAALTVLVWTAYWPSLKHGPRADQWHYLADTIDRNDFADLVLNTYSYNRTRAFQPGDAELFRPILFGVLAAEKAAFGTNLWMPQAVGILLHCGVIHLLLLLLKRVAALARETADGAGGRPGAFAALLPYAVVAFLALNASVIEQVVWAHLHGYLLFLVFLLGSLVLLLRGAAAPPHRAGAAVWGAWALAFLSAFTYEMGQFYAVLAGLFLAATWRRRLGARRALALLAAFASILLVYQTVNRLDWLVHRGRFTDEHTRQAVLDKAFTADTLSNAGRFTVYTAFQPFVPTAEKYTYVRERLNVPEWAWNGRPPRVGAAVLASLTLVPAAALALAGAWRLARPGCTTLLGVFLLFCSLYAVYAAMNVLGRMNLRPEPNVLAGNSYYAYPALLLALAAAFTVWQALGRAGRAGAACRAMLLVGLAASCVVNAPQVRRVDGMIGRDLRGMRRTTNDLNRFIALHRDEPDFSLGIDYAASEAVDKVDGFPIMTILFKRWMTAAEPKYLVDLHRGHVFVQTPQGGARASAPHGRDRAAR